MSFANRDRAKQLIDFEPLRYGGCLYTDIDATTEWHSKVFIFIEYKYDGAEVPLGQRLYLTHICDVIEQGGGHALAVVADHYTKNTDDDVNAGLGIVRESYHDSKWHSATCVITVKEYADRFLIKHM